jgi:carboxylate-amine ligase
VGAALDVLPPDWAEWTASPALTLGVEEEVMLLDAETWALTHRIDDVLEAVPAGRAGAFSAETHQSAVELATDPHRSVAEAIAELRRLRAQLAASLNPLGIAAAVGGTHACALWSEVEVSESSRHQLIHRTMRELASREPTFALHIHVGVPDPEAAIRLMNRMRVHLPLLLALSGNSPYWQGRDSGFASARTILFGTFPRTGLPRRFSGYDDWVDTVDTLIRCGALPEATFLWWDIRPQPSLGTVEIRGMDAQTAPEATGALCALVQSVAALELEEEGHASEAMMDSPEVLAENRFLAARDGVRAELIDVERGCRVPVGEQLAALLEAAQPFARRLGCTGELAALTGLVARSGADRQHASAQGPEGVEAVVPALASAFLGAQSPSSSEYSRR